jgi:hypothetical protein
MSLLEATRRPLLCLQHQPTRSAHFGRHGLVHAFFCLQVKKATRSVHVVPNSQHRLSSLVFTSAPVPLRPLPAICSVHTTSRPTEKHQPSGQPLQKKPLVSRQNVAEENRPQPADPHYLENYSKFFQNLAMSLPHLSRPTRDDFLNAATGFWSRLRVRFKWLTIRSFRKYNADDISAFVTWFFMSQTLWLLVGTCVAYILLERVVTNFNIELHSSQSYLRLSTAFDCKVSIQPLPIFNAYNLSIRICCKRHQRISHCRDGHHHCL